jgi:hypothetical protein
VGRATSGTGVNVGVALPASETRHAQPSCAANVSLACDGDVGRNLARVLFGHGASVRDELADSSRALRARARAPRPFLAASSAVGV